MNNKWGWKINLVFVGGIDVLEKKP